MKHTAKTVAGALNYNIGQDFRTYIAEQAPRTQEEILEAWESYISGLFGVLNGFIDTFPGPLDRKANLVDVFAQELQEKNYALAAELAKQNEQE